MVALLRAKREALQNVPSFTRACGPFARMEIQLRREPIQNIPPLIRVAISASSRSHCTRGSVFDARLLTPADCPPDKLIAQMIEQLPTPAERRREDIKARHRTAELAPQPQGPSME